MRYSLAYAALATTALAQEALVWTFDNIGRGPSISAENARLVLAHRLGLSNYHKLENADESVFNLMNNAQAPLFSELAVPKKLMLVFEGVVGNFLNLTTLEPSFTITNTPSVSVNEKLVSDLLLQDIHIRGGSRCGDNDFEESVHGGISSHTLAGLCMLGWPEEGRHESLRKLQEQNILDQDMEALSQFMYGQALPPSVASEYTAIFHVKSLENIAIRYGLQSEQYKQMLSAIQQTVSEGLVNHISTQLTIIGMPFKKQHDKKSTYGLYEMPLQTREEQPLTDLHLVNSAAVAQATSMANQTLPKTTISVCWSSKSTCDANTAGCSGHGECKKKYTEQVSDDESGAECWACACVPTVQQTADGQKTTYWGGPACQKKDISMPFFLFAGFTIAALVVLSSSIGLLYSIGEEDLPSVLGAGVAPPKK